MENQKTEKTIYLKDLIFSVLYQWKWILLAVLIGAIMLGGMELMNKEDTVTLNSVSITPENQIKIDQLQNNLQRTELLIESQTAYLEESVLMTLDPYTAYSAGMYVCVYPQSASDDRSAGIIRAFHGHLNSESVMEALSTTYEMNVRYFRELVTMSISDTNQLTITVRGRSSHEAQSIAESFAQAAQAFREDTSEMMELHNIGLISFNNGPRVDNSLYDSQNTAHQKLTTLKNTLTSTTTELNKLLPTQLVPGKSNPLLFAIVGAILGFCLVAGIACVSHIASGKVYSARTLKDRTGIRILGRVNGSKRNPIDSWLRKLEGRADYKELDAVTANIANHCAEVKNLLLLGCYDANALEPLTAELAQAGVQCTVCADPTRSAQAIKALPGCDAAVLVETCAKSTYDDVIWSVETVNDHGKTLLGCVLIDG